MWTEIECFVSIVPTCDFFAQNDEEPFRFANSLLWGRMFQDVTSVVYIESICFRVDHEIPRVAAEKKVTCDLAIELLLVIITCGSIYLCSLLVLPWIQCAQPSLHFATVKEKTL